MSEIEPTRRVRWPTSKGHTKWHAVQPDVHRVIAGRQAPVTLCCHTTPEGAEVTTEPVETADFCGQCRNRIKARAPKAKTVQAQRGGRYLAQWCPETGHGAYSSKSGACPVVDCATVASTTRRVEVTVSLGRRIVEEARRVAGRSNLSRSAVLTHAIESVSEKLESFFATIPDG